MSAINLVMLSGFVVVMAAGQLLFKATADRVSASAPDVGVADSLMAMLKVPQFWLALALYGVATVLWIIILQKIPLSRAYVFLALAFVLVPLAAALFFGERLTTQFVIGTGLIVAGVYLSGISQAG